MEINGQQVNEIKRYQKAEGIWRMGAELGYPVHQYVYAKNLDQAGEKAEALRWHEKAAAPLDDLKNDEITKKCQNFIQFPFCFQYIFCTLPPFVHP